jgi:putative beta-lysine N-acetyltransferase
MKLKGDAQSVIASIRELANKNGYTKIFCKIPSDAAPIFFSDGFILEAVIPGFYNKKQDVFFVSKFLNSDRLLNLEQKSFDELCKLLTNKKKFNKPDKNKSGKVKFRRLSTSDVDRITEIYREVFISYPFPIHNPGYILKTIKENVQYYGAEKDGRIIAIASCEIDFKGLNSEMTDFATDHQSRGNNLSVILLKNMEKEMKKQGIKTLYTIARLNSIPMNKTFLRLDYHYSGTLIKNTNIAGKIESMNVLYKHI